MTGVFVLYFTLRKIAGREAYAEALVSSLISGGAQSYSRDQNYRAALRGFFEHNRHEFLITKPAEDVKELERLIG